MNTHYKMEYHNEIKQKYKNNNNFINKFKFFKISLEFTLTNGFKIYMYLVFYSLKKNKVMIIQF